MKKSSFSPVDCYLVSAIFQFEPINENERNSSGYAPVWENTYFVKANHPIVAFDKGVKCAKKDQEEIEFKGTMGKWSYIGIKEVLPIYEKIEDGSEIMWTDWGKSNLEETASKVLSKESFSESIK